MSQPSAYRPTFTSSGSALRVLRAGKRNPNWEAAAEYLLERAAPDVKLLIEAALQLEHGTTQEGISPPARKPAWRWWHILLLVVMGAGVTALLIWIVNNAVLRQC